MKVLWLTLAENREACYGLTERLMQLFELTSRWLTPKEARNVAKAIGGKQIKQFDRIVMQLPLALLLKQAAYLRCIPNLVLLVPELPEALKQGSGDAQKFLKLMDQMPWVRLLLPAAEGIEALQKKDLDLGVVPMGFNGLWYKDKGDSRSIHAAVFADVESPPLRERKSLVFEVKTQNRLQIFDPVESQALAEQLNQVGIAVCNDQGCAQYRALNFQAMASGAALMTWDRGAAENRLVGFRDMVNVMLYQDAKSAQAKINFLKRHPEELDSIRESGKALAMEQHSNRALAEKLSDHLGKSLQPFQGDDIEDALRFKFF